MKWRRCFSLTGLWFWSDHGDDQELRLGKEERGKQNELKEKVKFIGPFVLVIKTPSGCDHI